MTAIGSKECPRVVRTPGFAVHGDFGPGPFQPIGPVEGCELAALFGIHDFGRAELADGLVQGLEAGLGLQRVGYPPGQHLAGEPVHDSDGTEKAFAHRQTGDVGAPDLIGPVDPQPAQQAGAGLVPLGRLAGVRLLIDRQ